MAATGNSIDAGMFSEVNIEHQIKNSVENSEFADSDLKSFKNKLDPDTDILIIGDNSGEAVFDKLLIEELNDYGVDITYATREVPVLNDITLKEAKKIGLSEVCKVISSGSKAPGMILKQANDEFINVYQRADIIISKGQGNLEALSDVKEPIFFLLKAKCKLVAQLLEVDKGELVFKLNDKKSM